MGRSGSTIIFFCHEIHTNKCNKVFANSIQLNFVSFYWELQTACSFVFTIENNFLETSLACMVMTGLELRLKP